MPKTIKIAITGPESSGKTRLSNELSAHYSAAMVPEFAREYLRSLHRPYTQKDLEVISKGQLNSELQAAQDKANLIICDTDTTVLKIWSFHSFGCMPQNLSDAIQATQYDFTLLCYPDLAWESDPLREHPSEEDRLELFREYKTSLISENRQFAVVKGFGAMRTQKAIKLIDQFISQKA